MTDPVGPGSAAPEPDAPEPDDALDPESDAPEPDAPEPDDGIDPLRLSFDVGCVARHAFETWTDRFGTWWPRGHTVSGHPEADVVLEPGVGGRIFERTPDGDEVDWGEVTAWDAPRRLAYLWHIRRDRADATDVEITFVALEDGTTRIDIVHTGWERLGAEGRSWRDANAGGWNGLMPHFTAAAARAVRPDDKESTT